MTDPELTPAESERVSRLLAEARHTEPLPADVAARLDGVLRDLGAERRASEPVTPPGAVVSLDAHRRRRRAGALLVAAAAVTVIGVGIRPALDSLGGNDSGSASVSAEEAPSTVPDEAADGVDPRPEAFGADGGEAGSRAATDDREPLELSPRSFERDARKAAELDLSRGALEESPTALVACPGAASWGEGRLVRVRYDGQLGVLILRAPEGDTQRADLYLCGSPRVVRSVLLPAP